MYFYGKKRGKNKLLNHSELKFDKKLEEVAALLAFYVEIKVFVMFFLLLGKQFYPIWYQWNKEQKISKKPDRF